MRINENGNTIIYVKFCTYDPKYLVPSYMKVNTSYLLAVAVIVGAEPPDHATVPGQVIV